MPAADKGRTTNMTAAAAPAAALTKTQKRLRESMRVVLSRNSISLEPFK